MRPLILLLTALVLPLAAGKVSFDKDDRFSLEFPDTWVKAKTNRSEALVYRQHKDGDASFTVTGLSVPAGRRADLHATLKTLVNAFKQANMTVLGDVNGQEGEVDAKKAVFGVVPATLKIEDQTTDLRFFLVLIEASERIIILEAALPASAPNELRGECRKIIGSFHEKGADDAQKKEDEDKDGE